MPWQNFTISNVSECQRVFASNNTIPLNSNFFALAQNGAIHEVYQIQSKFYCRQLSKPSYESVVNRLARRKYFGSEVKITATAAVDNTTLLEVVYNEVNGTVISAAGLAVNIFKDLEFILGFRGLYIRGDWVMKNSQGLPSGLTVDQLQQGVADIYITQTTMAAYRAIGLSFLQPTFQDGLFAFLKQPPSSSVRDVHISTFAYPLWMIMFGTWLILAIGLFVIRIAHGVYSKIEGLTTSVLWSISAITNQGWYKFPEATPKRIIFFTGSLLGVIVYIVYSGGIISALTLESPPIKSFQDLLKSPMVIYVDDKSTTLKLIVGHLRITNPRPHGYKLVDELEGLKRIIEQPGAVFAFYRNFYKCAYILKIPPNKLCDCVTHKFPIIGRPLQLAMMVPRWSPYRETFNKNIIKMRQRGLVDRHVKRFLSQSITFCSTKEIVYRENLSLQDVFTAFALLGFGISISLVLIILEKFQSILSKSRPNAFKPNSFIM